MSGHHHKSNVLTFLVQSSNLILKETKGANEQEKLAKQ